MLLALVAAGLLAVAMWGGAPARLALTFALAVALAFTVHAMSVPPTNGAVLFDPSCPPAYVANGADGPGRGRRSPWWRWSSAAPARCCRSPSICSRPRPILEARWPSYPADRRRELPDEPGVYLFRDERGKVIYVGKANSIKKRVASHFSNPSTRAGRDLIPMIDQIEALVVHTEAEALLVEQNFIKQYKPRFNIRLRDDKSYPYIAISLDEEFPRVYFTRERHRRDRAYFGPYSNAKRVRSTLEVLGKVFMFRSCDGPEPGRRSGSPCLDYYIKRCEAPCVGYVDREGYRKAIDGVIAFLSGRYKEIEWALDEEMKLAADEQRFEDAARERNRLRAVRSLLERQRVAHDGDGSMDAIAVAMADGEANAQVFQIRDGVLSDRQSFYLDNTAGAEIDEVAEAFILQYYASAMSVPPLVVVQREIGPTPGAGRGAVRAPGRRR